jgi:hypothetical protein
MPKIRQALAVLAAAASCIAFNTYRYPVVREMVAAISLPPQPEDVGPAKKPTDLAAVRTQKTPVASETPSPRHAAVCKDGVCSLPLPDSPTASLNGATKTMAVNNEPGEDKIDGATPRESTSNSQDRLASTSPGDKTPRTSEESRKTAKSSQSSKCNGYSLDEQKSTVKDARSAESLGDSSHTEPNRAEPGANALADTKNLDHTPIHSATELAAKGSAPSRDPSAPLYGKSDGYESPHSDSVASRAIGREREDNTTPDRPSPSSVCINDSSSGGYRQPAKAAPLVPIVRPAGRRQPSETAAAKVTAGFQLAGQRGTKSTGVRPLPPVSSDRPEEPPAITADLARAYPVTSAE